MAKESSGLTLTTDYFMRRFYNSNRSMLSAGGRSDFSKLELSYEDTRALSKAAKQLVQANYGDEKGKDDDIDETTKSTIEAFVKTYNHAIESSASGDYDTLRTAKKMKALSKKYEKELSDIGINIENNGTLTIKEDLLKMSNQSKVRKVFSAENGYSKKALSISKKMNESIRNHVLSEMTGNGLKINISL